MKKICIMLLATVVLSLQVKAQKVVEDNFTRLRVSYSIPGVTVVPSAETGYVRLDIDGATPGGKLGQPELPQLNHMLTIPLCKGMEVNVTNAVYDTLPIEGTVMPLQPSRSKSDRGEYKLTIDKEAYSTDDYLGQEVATVEAIGIGRDRNLARLTFSPVRINPVSNKMIVCRSAEIEVVYIAPDKQATLEMYRRYHTPAFSVGTTLNDPIPPKYVSPATPIRMVVLVNSSLRCHALNQFIDWKRQQGFRVDLFDIDEMGIQAASAIDNKLKSLYTNASDDEPAPAYLIIVGDVAQVPSHTSKLSSNYENDHITDLYYTTWTSGDLVPDCYHGRFSATDTNTLRNIISKTMLYEKYDFSDDSYLARAALIAGVDYGYSGDHGYTHADPAMDYAARHYVNHTNGYDTVTYFKNLTTSAPTGVYVTGSSRSGSASSTLKNFYNQGAGWVNYSAHGDWDCWGTPSFSVSDANNMTNNGKPAFMIGNCCLTNKFEKAACLGEALLRKGNNAGAIGYIGGSNYTYWGEDFYWAVGVRSNISGSMNLDYNASNLGSYDHLFHTHSEASTAYATTAGKIMMFGNMAVQSSSSSLKDYYWEIYHLMGDPSLMPWLGRAEEMNVYHEPISGTTLRVHAVPYAYVAIVSQSDHSVLAASFAGSDGVAALTVPGGSFAGDIMLTGCLISVNAQGYKPYSKAYANVGIDDAVSANTSIYPNPASGSCTVSCDGMRSVRIINAMGQTVGTVRATSGTATIPLQGLAAGVYMLQVETTSGTAVKKLIVQ